MVLIFSGVGAVLFGLIVWYSARVSKRFAAACEAISFSVPFKIYFATCQILGAYATLLSHALFQPLKELLDRLSVATDLAELFSGFGVSCAYYELRAFKSKLLLSMIVPIALSLCIAVVFKCRAFLHPNCAKSLRQAHATFALLLLYVTLPSTSTTIFKTFVRDSRPLGTSGEQYLIADYAGKSPQQTACF